MQLILHLPSQGRVDTVFLLDFQRLAFCDHSVNVFVAAVCCCYKRTKKLICWEAPQISFLQTSKLYLTSLERGGE